MGTPAIDTDRLALDKRLRLIGDLWDSLRSCPDMVPLTPLQREELDRRLDELEQGKVGLVLWDEVKQAPSYTT